MMRARQACSGLRALVAAVLAVAAVVGMTLGMTLGLNAPLLAQTPGAGDFLRQMPAPAAQPPAGTRQEPSGAQPSTGWSRRPT